MGRADGEQVSARVVVRSIRVEKTYRRRVQRTVAIVRDETGEAEAVWFGRRYIERRIREGDRLVVSGRLKKRGFAVIFDDPEFQREDAEGDLLHAGRIVPIYRLTAGIAAPRLRLAMREAIDRAGLAYPEYLPAGPARSERLVGIGRAIEGAHYPDDPEALDAALRRLAFDELLALQLGMVGRRRQRVRSRAQPLEVDDARDLEVRDALVGALLGEARAGGRADRRPARRDRGRAGRPRPARADAPAAPGRRRVGQDRRRRLRPRPRRRRRTAGRPARPDRPAGPPARGDPRRPARAARDPGHAPDRLAERGRDAQGARGDRGRARRASSSGPTRSSRSGSASPTSGLAVIDEQHRFGVEQRGQLEAKAGGTAPHVLLMTATPIPRTLGQVLYADLDVTDLRTPPEGRIPIRTGIRHPADLDAAVGRSSGPGGRRASDVRRRAARSRNPDDEGHGRARRPRPSGCASCSRRSGSGSSTGR